MIKVDARIKARAETCIWETAFGDASIADAESDSRRFYALRLGKFNATERNISA